MFGFDGFDPVYFEVASSNLAWSFIYMFFFYFENITTKNVSDQETNTGHLACKEAERYALDQCTKSAFVFDGAQLNISSLFRYIHV